MSQVSAHERCSRRERRVWRIAFIVSIALSRSDDLALNLHYRLLNLNSERNYWVRGICAKLTSRAIFPFFFR
jgi:hypothetical protein